MANPRDRFLFFGSAKFLRLHCAPVNGHFDFSPAQRFGPHCRLNEDGTIVGSSYNFTEGCNATNGVRNDSDAS